MGPGAEVLPQRSAVKKFSDLLPEIRDSLPALPDLNARVEAIAGLDGRLPLALGLRCLSIRQQAALQVLGPRTEYHPAPSRPSEPALRLGMRSYGRLVLEPSPLFDEGDIEFGWIPVGAAEQARIDALEAGLRRRHQEAQAEVDGFLGALGPEQLGEVLGTVAFMVDHTDPVLIYVDESVYTLFGRHNNLLEERKTGGSRFLFSELPKSPPSQWSRDDRTFIACMYWMKRAGLRGEEFNGAQMGPLELHPFMDQRIRALAKALGRETPSLGTLDLASKAELAGGMKEEAREGHVVSRWVQGLNFYKEERLIPKRELQGGVAALDQALSGYLRHSAGIEWQGGDLSGVFSRWLALALDGQAVSRNPSSMHPVEDMVHFLVEQAIEIVGADIAMSRSLRNYRNLMRIHDQRLPQEACDWPITDYFCCVVPSAGMKRGLQGRPGLMFTVLNAVSHRMNYNSWHYVPGHFDLAAVPKDRHFYFPPRMPDTAEWSSLHHAGHVLATVLYSIRSPGAVRYGGKDWFGLYDLRLMRQAGEPFTQDHLKTSVKVTAYLGALYQALMDHQAAGGPAYAVRAFDKDWFQRVYP